MPKIVSESEVYESEIEAVSLKRSLKNAKQFRSVNFKTMAFRFATVPPQPTLLEARGEVVDTEKPSGSESEQASANATIPSTTDILVKALSSGGLVTPEVTRGHGGQDIALVEADPFRNVPGLQVRYSVLS